MTTDFMSPDPSPASHRPSAAVPARTERISGGTSRPAVFDAIRRLGTTSRVELAQEIGVTAATVTHAVRALLAEGLIVETGVAAPTRGKPRVMLSLAPKAQCAVGVQLEADWTVIAVVDASGALLARQRIRGARSAAPEAVIERVARHVLALLRAGDVPVESALGLGLVLPGRLDVEAGTLSSSPSLPGWVGVRVRSLLEEATGLPVALGNDATAAAQGELWSGAVGSSRAHGTVCMGASIGLGLVLEGRVHQGSTANAGALGAVTVPPSGATLADLTAPPAVAAAARASLPARRSALRLSEDGDPFVDFGAISAAAVSGDRFATELVEESARQLAEAVTTVARLLDLESISLTGPSFAVAGSIYLSVLRARLSKDASGNVAARLSMQTTDAAAVGAASMILGVAMPALAEDASSRR